MVLDNVRAVGMTSYFEKSHHLQFQQIMSDTVPGAGDIIVKKEIRLCGFSGLLRG